MKALSIHSIYASAIACCLKIVELRSWRTSYRDDILICSTIADSKSKDLKDCFIFGKALAVATIRDCRPFQESDRLAAFIEDDFDAKNLFSWEFDNIRPIKPFNIKGQQRLLNVDVKNIEYLNIDPFDELDKLEEYWISNGYIKEFPWEY